MIRAPAVLCLTRALCRTQALHLHLKRRQKERAARLKSAGDAVAGAQQQSDERQSVEESRAAGDN